MAAIDLTTASDVKTWLSGQGNSIGNTDDNLLARLVTAASSFILGYTNRPTFFSKAFVDVFQGHGEKTRVLTNSFPSYGNAPAATVQVVKVGSITVPVSTDRVMNGYVLVGNELNLIGYCFESKVFCEVDYTSGFVNIAGLPFDLTQACIELVALKYRRRKSINLVSESLSGMTTAYSQKDVTDDIRSVLDRYKQVLTQ